MVSLLRLSAESTIEDSTFWHTLRQIEGYLLIPHELLHVLGYRLAGKRCRYRWGSPYVTPIGPLTQREELVGLLFPFLTCLALFILFMSLSTLAAVLTALRHSSPFWIVFWSGLAIVAGIYNITSLLDLRRAYWLILGKPKYSWTPFDFFLGPIVENRSVTTLKSGGTDPLRAEAK